MAYAGFQPKDQAGGSPDPADYEYEARYQTTATYESTYQSTKTYESTYQATKTYESRYD